MNSLTAIACMASNRVIGAKGGTPWHYPADLRFFKAETIGHTVIMGRKTWESLPNGPLRDRRNIVMSKFLLESPGVELAFDVEGLERLLRGGRAFVIGGAEIYRLLLPWTDQVLLTVLDRPAEGDTLMPAFEEEFGPPEILECVPGVAEWRRYVRIQRPSPSLMETNRQLALMPPAGITAEDARRQVEEHRSEAEAEINKANTYG